MNYTVITAKLKARTAVHIGSGQSSGLTDALIRRDGAGKPVIPGTAIAGALRSMLTRLGPRLGAGECVVLAYSPDKKEARESCNCGICHLFGDVNPGDEDNSKSEASRLLVFNATLSGQSQGVAIRDGVGLNRVTRAAARAGAVKFDLETLAAGAEFDLQLELRKQNEADEKLLAAALAEWQAGRAWLGGRVARGLGAFELTGLTFGRLELNQTDDLMAFLKSDQPQDKIDPVKNWLTNKINNIIPAKPVKNQYAACSWFRVEATLQATGPLLTNDTLSSGLTGFDHAPLLAQWGNWTQPVLAGSGLRGVIRSHAERLARTLTTLNLTANGPQFLKTCPACSPVEGKTDQPLASCDSLIKKDDAITIDTEIEDKHLCLACRLFGSSGRGSRLFVEDAPYAKKSDPKLKMLDFLAVDRFTGGGAAGAKFDALALWRPAFRLRLHLDNPEPWELGWLALVLRDMQAEWLPVGMGAAKGFGRVKLTDLQMSLGYLSDDDLALYGLSATADEKSGVYRLRPALISEAQSWLDAFKQKVETFKREEDLALQTDGYFDGVLPQLYEIEVTL